MVIGSRVPCRIVVQITVTAARRHVVRRIHAKAQVSVDARLVGKKPIVVDTTSLYELHRRRQRFRDLGLERVSETHARKQRSDTQSSLHEVAPAYDRPPPPLTRPFDSLPGISLIECLLFRNTLPAQSFAPHALALVVLVTRSSVSL